MRTLAMAVLILGIGCSGTPPGAPDASAEDASLDASAWDASLEDASVADAGSDAGLPDAGLPGAVVRFSARSTEHCAVEPPASPGLARLTPTASRAGVTGLELLRTRDDPSPVLLPLPSPIVEVNFTDGGLVSEAQIPPGRYRFVRYSLAWASVTVPATAHQGAMTLQGQLEFDVATAAHTQGGRTRPAGELITRFTAPAFSSNFTATVALDCPLSESGGLVETGGAAHRITVPMPGGELIVHTGDAPRERTAIFPLAGAFTWRDSGAAGFAPGVVDIQWSPTGSETPARLPICDLLLSDRCEADAAPVHSAPAWPMPDSASTTCTDGSAVAPCPDAGTAFFGQDGSSSVNAPRLVVVGEMVRDEVTGLLWQREAAPAPLDWWGARDYCQALVLGGRDDWTLPSRLELASILDVGRFGPSIDLAAFPTASPDFFWSASPALFSSLAFGIRFDQGFVYDHDPRVSGRVRCVAGGREGPPGRLTVAGPLVRDGATGLTWERATRPPATWASALVTCDGLALGGLSGWRLPTAKELLTIVEDRALSPSTDLGAFPDTPAEWLWSSSPGLAPPSYAWTVSFTDGFSTPAAVTQLYAFKCVLSR